MGCCHSTDRHSDAPSPNVSAKTSIEGDLHKAEAKASKQVKVTTSTHKGLEASSFSKIVEWKAGTETGWCSGCLHNIGSLLDRWKSNGKVISPKLALPVTFHESFAELEECCEKCIVCRAIRQALLLRQASSETYAGLLTKQKMRASLLSIDQGPGEIDHSVGELWIRISAGEDESYETTAFLCCSTSTRMKIDSLNTQPVHFEELLPQITTWLAECEEKHFKPCGQLNWSNKNPTRLIEIQANRNLRLVETADMPKRVPYMALSYVWGRRADSNTTQANLSSRLRSLLAADLLATQRDAIELARMVGIHHVWIDAICIVQDSSEDWAREAALMHEYYGNAHFTLCVISSIHADEGFLHYREAWKYKQLNYQLNGVRLMNVDTSLDDARLRSPHATRGWTLQEEYLSPRRLYWHRSSIYWSCAVHTRAEGIAETTRRPVHSVSADSQLMSKFLLAGYRIQKQDLHRIWLGIVESYARRNLTEAADKANAISGIASRCSTPSNEYLAGLWSDTFAEELVWKLDSAKWRQAPDDDSTDHAPPPSWSWMSLQVACELHFQTDFTPAERFALLKRRGNESDAADAQPHERVQRGNLVTRVTVQGRMRSFWTANSRLVPWNEVLRRTSHFGPQNPTEEISFQAFRSEDAHSVNTTSGLLAVSQQHAEEIVAHLDYLDDAVRISQGSLNVEVMEVGQTAMILLHRTGDKDGSYRRIGACHEVREGFFVGVRVREICLS